MFKQDFSCAEGLCDLSFEYYLVLGSWFLDLNSWFSHLTNSSQKF